LPFDGLFVPVELRRALDDEAWLRALLDVERALAAAEAAVGVIPAEAAAAIAAVCEPGRFDAEALAESGRRVGNVAEPLVRALREAVGGEAARFVHWGATSQDVLDSAAALVARDAGALVVAELEGVAGACAALARAHRSTVMAARTLLQQAVPTTFGLKAAGWLVTVSRASTRLEAARIPAQLGGAGGTLAALGDRGLDVLGAFAAELGLEEPTLPWHSIRVPVAHLGSTLDVAAAVLAKIALDLLLLGQTEVGEVREPAGGSSTMPHKRNPVGSVLVRACAAHVHAAAGTLTGAVHEHERAAGAWHAEWKALTDALAFTGGAAWWLRRTLEGLEVDPARMRANLRDETLSEAAAFAPDAREPEDYLGSAEALVDRALERYRPDGPR
jgi:3-carboxy-cis,cis-muconate cycloisomerase